MWRKKWVSFADAQNIGGDPRDYLLAAQPNPENSQWLEACVNYDGRLVTRDPN
jgi:hypothetical protein